MKIDSVERAPRFHSIQMPNQNEMAIHVVCSYIRAARTSHDRL